MADPTPYVPGFDYSAFEAANPTLPKPGGQLDNDFANIELTTDELIDALGDIRRSDGALNNGIVTVDSLSTSVKALFGATDDFQVVVDNIDDIIAVADDIANVNTVAINIVAIDTVADNVAVITANAANIATVAGSIANVNAVAGEIVAVETVAANLVDISSYFDRELGPKTADPTLRNDGSALQVDDRYFNTVSNQYRVYNGTTWQSTVGAQLDVANTWSANQTFSRTDPGTIGPTIALYHNSASPSASDIIGDLLFRGNSGGSPVTYARIAATITDPTGGSWDGRLHLQVHVNGVATDTVTVDGGQMRSLVQIVAPSVTLTGPNVVRDVGNGNLTLSGGTSGALGANLELYGETHPTQANNAFLDADTINFRSQSGALRATINSSGLSLASPMAASNVSKTANAVGTYGLLCNNGVGIGSHGPGGTVAGSSLLFAGIFGLNAAGNSHIETSGTVFPAGTWQCMGRQINTGAANERGVTLWVRIA